MGPSVSRSRRGRRRLFDDINITPLTDVMLVLLIIFMVTAQFIEPSTPGGLDLRLPSAGSTDNLDSLGGLRVSVDRLGAMTLDGRPIDPANLPAELRAAAQSPQQMIIVEGDRDTVLQNVVTIMDAALSVGMPNLVLATSADLSAGLPPAPAEAASPFLTPRPAGR